MKRYNQFPAGPRPKAAKGLFVTRGKGHKTPKAVAAAKAEAMSGQPRKNGAPFQRPVNP